MNQLTAVSLIANAQAIDERSALSTASTDNRHFALRQGPKDIHLQIRTDCRGILLHESRYPDIATAKADATSLASCARCGDLVWVDTVAVAA